MILRWTQISLWLVTFALWQPWGFDGVLPPKELMWQACSLILLGFVFWKPPSLNRGIGPLAVFAILGLMSLAITGPTVQALRMVGNLLLGLFWVWVLANTVTFEDMPKLFRTISVIAIVHAGFGLIQCWRDPLFNAVDLFNRPGYAPQLKDRLFGFMSAPAHYAASLALAWPLSLSWPRRARFWIGIGLAGMVFLTENTTASIALSVAGLYLIWRWASPRWRSPSLWGALAISLLLISHQPSDLGGRPLVWKEMLDVIPLHPWIGQGFGVFGHTLRLVVDEAGHRTLWVHPHNEWLALAFTSGFLGLLTAGAVLVWLAILIQHIRPLGLARRWNPSVDMVIAGLLVFAVEMLANYPLHVAPLAFVGLIDLALLIRWGQETSRPLAQIQEVPCQPVVALNS